MKVNEIFHSLQGEGFWTGTPMTFIRLSGCNLSCKFCDTKHEKSTNMTPKQILKQVKYLHVCITGGEPTEQDLLPLIDELKDHEIHLETNGTNSIPYQEMWITLSPKQTLIHTHMMIDEVKFLCGKELSSWEEIVNKILPQVRSYTELYIMPISGPHLKQNTKRAIQYVMDNPQFKLTIQQHKLLGYK